MEDFKEFISNCQVVEVIPKNGKFTWTNIRLNFSKISERLDRFFAGEWWINGSFSINTNIVLQAGLDRLPVTLSINHEAPKNKNYFKFQSMWWRDPKFIGLLKSWWLESKTFSGSPSFCFVKRIQYIKNKIKHWNKFSFKNIFSGKLRIEEELEDINSRVMLVGMVREDFLKEKLLKEQYAELLNREEVYWRDKSRALWIAEGDRNTKFFHAISKVRRNKNKITPIIDDGGTLRSNPGQAGYGAIIWNEDRNIMFGTYGNIGCATNNEVEIRSLEAGLLLCKQKGLSNVQIEGDS
ncbi:uncharacterized protein LOC131858848 [Cryptomeria japonica]|uniref:uncharacterized protein LOC131858848 n=1 Tax=Cryptomeria japonica TaxID=3369 RepID=UPI0027DA36CB|nr:uncharacterized protein LOC131858848 [Cryptomeria japonica]